MSDDEALLEELAGKHGMTVQKYREAKTDEGWQAHQMKAHLFGSSLLAGMAGTREGFVANEIYEVPLRKLNYACILDMIDLMTDLIQEYKKRLAKRVEGKSIERWIRVQNQDQALDFLLKVKVDTGANCNAITHGVLIDHKLESRITRLDPPHEIYLAVGKPILCDEAITIPWVGKGNETYGEAKFYVLPQGEANITHRAILAEEWQGKTELLFDENEYNSLEPLMVKRESASEKVARERARKEAERDRASSASAKNAYQNTGGQKDQGSSSKGSSCPSEAGK